MIITRKGMARPDGSPIDVDRELVTGFIEVDENHSWYVEENISTYTTDPKGTLIARSPFGDMIVVAGPGKPGAPAVPPDPTAIGPAFGAWFKETINGYSYGHTPGLTMKVGQRVRWYLMGSTNFEFHAPHWHGNVVDVNHMRTDVGFPAADGHVRRRHDRRTTRASGCSTVTSRRTCAPGCRRSTRSSAEPTLVFERDGPVAAPAFSDAGTQLASL